MSIMSSLLLQVSKYGMSDEIGPLYVPDEKENNITGIKPYSQALERLIDLEIRKLVAASYARAEQILTENRDKLEALAEALLQKETLNYDQVVELIGPPKYESATRQMDPADFEHSLKNLSMPSDDDTTSSTPNEPSETGDSDKDSRSTKMF